VKQAHFQERAANLGLCPALRALEQGKIIIVPTPDVTWGRGVPVSFEGPFRLVASYDTQRGDEDLFYNRIEFPNPKMYIFFFLVSRSIR
jgi:hypothetical protein